MHQSVCTSVNEIICHGIPDTRELQEGDIVNIDVTTYVYIHNMWCVYRMNDLVSFYTNKQPHHNGMKFESFYCVYIYRYVDGYHGDLNETFLVGKVDEDGRHLVKVML